MAERSFGLPVLTIGGLLAVVAALFRGAGSPSPPGQDQKPNEPPAAIAKDTGHAYQTGRDLLVAHLGHSLDTLENDVTLGILIATVPDPVDSHEDWMYDAHIEAIRRALETSRYFLDRFWLPWPSDTSTVKPEKSTRRVPTREGKPGVMLFRGGKHRLLLLYVVGELPTEGVRRWALRQALEERDSILRDWHEGGGALEAWRHQVRIIGPTFSGSANSAQEVADEWLSKKHRDTTTVRATVLFVSGSATSLRRECTLHADSMKVIDKSGRTFCVTVYTDSITRRIAACVLPQLGITASRVAILREASSQYGSGFKDSTPSKFPEAAACGDSTRIWVSIPVPMNIATLRGVYEQNPGPQQPAERRLGRAPPRIPLTLQEPTRPQETPAIISRLSAPYSDLVVEEILRTLQRLDVEAVGLMFTDVRDKLFLGELVKRRMPDVQLFTFGGHLLYARADRRDWLNGMLVFSTYPLVLNNQWWLHPDSTKQSKMAFPTDGAEGTYNATLLLLGKTDQMLDYGGPSDIGRRGSIVRRRPPVWVSVVGAEGMFPLRADAGDSFPDSISVVSISGQPFATPDEVEPTLSVLAITSALLVMILSIAALVLLYRRFDESVMVATAIQRWLRTKRALGHLVWVPGNGLVKWGPTLVALRFIIFARKYRNRTRPARTAVRHPSYGYRILLQFQRMMYFSFLFVGLIGLMVPIWFLVRESPLRYGLLLAFAAALWGWLQPLAWTGWLVFRRWTGLFTRPAGTRAFTRWSEPSLVKPGPGRPPEPLGIPMPSRAARLGEVFGRSLVLLLVIAYLVLLIRFALMHSGDRSFEAILFRHRALAMSSGVSPLLPIGLGTAWFIAWCFWHLKRIEYLNQTTAFELAVVYAEGATQPPLFERVAPSVIGLRRQLLLLIPTWRELAAVAVILGVGGYVIITFDAGTLESIPSVRLQPFGWLLGLMIFGAMVATALSGFRFFIVWRDLQSVLLRVSTTPLVWAFERLPVRISRLVHLTLAERSSAATIAAVLWLQRQHLQRIYLENRSLFEPYLGGRSPGRGALRSLPHALSAFTDGRNPSQGLPEAVLCARRVLAARAGKEGNGDGRC